MDAPAASRVEITDEQLRAAWAKCRNSMWPATFEETMADPSRARVVEVVAHGMARKRADIKPTGTLEVPVCRVHGAACQTVQASRRCANCPHRPPRQQHFTPPPGYVDRKRLAAGDRDDD
jgi:hypothetical protein